VISGPYPGSCIGKASCLNRIGLHLGGRQEPKIEASEYESRLLDDTVSGIAAIRRAFPDNPRRAAPALRIQFFGLLGGLP